MNCWSAARWRAGTVNWGVRWKTVRLLACLAMTGMDWTPLEPVPMTPTRLPEKSTGSWGQLPVWYQSPWKESRPSISGTLLVEMQPMAVMRYCTVTRSPWSVEISQRLVSSLNVAAVTRVLNWMLRRRSKAVGDVFEVGEDFGLLGVFAAPGPVLEEFLRE